jgi:catalase
MPGFGVHTFKMINEAGKETYVKFHWKTQQGEATLTNEQADEVEAGLGPKKPVTATLDLFNSIEKGERPFLVVKHGVGDSNVLRPCIRCKHAPINVAHRLIV